MLVSKHHHRVSDGVDVGGAEELGGNQIPIARHVMEWALGDRSGLEFGGEGLFQIQGLLAKEKGLEAQVPMLNAKGRVYDSG